MKGLFNKTRRRQLCSRIVYCRNLFSQGTGLTFRPKKSVDDCAWIFIFNEPRIVSLTMAFVFFPIDALFLDGNKRIVEIKQDFKPWQLYFPTGRCSYVIELKNKTVKSSGTRVGDLLEFIE
jgi:uncharacterized membrane protein (UPF0127 family)